MLGLSPNHLGDSHERDASKCSSNPFCRSNAVSSFNSPSKSHVLFLDFSIHSTDDRSRTCQRVAVRSKIIESSKTLVAATCDAGTNKSDSCF